MITKDLIRKYRRAFNTDFSQDPNCQAAWAFLEGSGTTVADSSQNSNTGNFRGSDNPPWTETVPKAYMDYGVDFTGKTAWINGGNNSSINIAANYAICTWAYNPGTYAIHQLIIGFRDGVDQDFYMLQLYNTNNLECRFRRSGGVYTMVVALPSGQFNFLFFKKSSTRIRIYINGVDTNNAGCSGSSGTGEPFNIGARITKTRYYFKDKLAESGIFNRDVDLTEINEIMDYGLRGPQEVPYPTRLLRKDVISGYHCFMGAYMDAKRKEYDPLKLPDGTIF